MLYLSDHPAGAVTQTFGNRWGSLGLWDISRLRVESVEPLMWDHPVVVEANGVLLRPIA